MKRFLRLNLMIPIALLFIFVYGSGALSVAGRTGAVQMAVEAGIPWRVFGNFYIVCGFLTLGTMLLDGRRKRMVTRLLVTALPVHLYLIFSLLYTIEIRGLQPFGHAAFEVNMVMWAIWFEAERDT